MSLRVAVQMDPLDAINIEGDSTFAIMLGAQARGHRLWHYAADALSWKDGRLWTMGYPVTVQRVATRSPSPMTAARSECRSGKVDAYLAIVRLNPARSGD